MENLKPINIDWNSVRDNKELDGVFGPSINPSIALAQKFERSLFVYMRNMRISSIYTWNDFSCDGGTASWTWCFDKERPEGHECFHYDFRRLLALSDEEFDRLPATENKDVVREWREAMI